MKIVKWLGLLVSLLFGVLLRVDATDVVYSPGENFGPTYTVPISMETTPDYSYQDNIIQEARLNCFDCTSYMPECRRVVSDREGLIVSRTGCQSKCFLRVGEEKSGALYRGCMDDFTSAKLKTDYVGCKVQEWNGRKTLWCLCDDDLCNGESLKNLFYYGYGKGAATVAFDEPAETAFLEPISSVDAEFEQMTGSLDNYNSLYALEPKTLEKEVVVGNENIVEEPIVSTTSTAEYREPVGQTEDIPSSKDILTQFREEFHQPDPHYFPPEQIRHVSDYENGRYPPEPEQTVRRKDSEGYMYPEEHPSTQRYPMVPPDYTDDPTNGGQYPPPSPYEVPVSYFYPPPGFHPYLSPFPPRLNTHLKHPDAYGPPHPPMSYTKREDGPIESPEGKSGNPFATYDKFGPIPHQDYQYNYQEGPADFELEQVSYFPYDETQQYQRGETPQLKEDLKTQKSVPTQEEAPKDVDTDLFCPGAGIFTYEEDCSKFVMCLIDHLMGRPRMYIMKCPGGLVFDSVANTCMTPERSDGCKRLPEEDRRVPPVTTVSPQMENIAPHEETMGGIYTGNNVDV